MKRTLRWLLWPGVIFWLVGALLAIDIAMILIARRAGGAP